MPTAHLKPMNPDAKATLLRRPKPADGQIPGLPRNGEPAANCVDILQRAAAARAALHEVGRALVGGHVERCVVDAVRSGSRRDRDRKVSELLRVLSQLDGG